MPRDRLFAVYEPSSPGRRERDTDFDNSDSDSSRSGDSGSTLPDTRHAIDPLRNHRPRHAPSNANSHPEAIPRMQMIDEALLPVTLLDGTPYPVEQRLLDKVLNFSTAPHAPFVHPIEAVRELVLHNKADRRYARTSLTSAQAVNVALRVENTMLIPTWPMDHPLLNWRP